MSSRNYIRERRESWPLRGTFSNDKSKLLGFAWNESHLTTFITSSLQLKYMWPIVFSNYYEKGGSVRILSQCLIPYPLILGGIHVMETMKTQQVQPFRTSETSAISPIIRINAPPLHISSIICGRREKEDGGRECKTSEFHSGA